MSVFVVYRAGNDVLLDVETTQGGVSFAIDETTQVGFELADPPSVEGLSLWLGDEALEKPDARRRYLDWQVRPYFDGAWGPTPIVLRSSEARPQVLATALVRRSKLSEATYERLFSDISQIAVGLLMELLSKSGSGSRSVRRSDVRAMEALSPQLEFARLQLFWRRFRTPAATVAREPADAPASMYVRRRPRPGERLDATAQARLRQGRIGTRHTAGGGAETAIVPLRTVFATHDIAENHVLLAFLHLLAGRVRYCMERARDETVRLRRQLRELPTNDGRFLQFETERTTPRLDRLEQVIESAQGTLGEIARIRSAIASRVGVDTEVRHVGRRARAVAEPMPSRPHIARTLATSLFRSHPHYAGLARLMDEFLRTSSVVVESGEETAGKPLWRLYEQWAFFQIVAGLRRHGLACVSHRSLFEPLARDRFTIDVQRNTALTFEADDGLRVAVRYEPIIMSRRAATGADTVYRGTEADTPWRPDILIEAFVERNGAFELVYAAVCDAKYTLRAREEKLQNLAKYQQIRSVHSDKQIVRQVWAVIPAEPGVRPSDDAVVWTEAGSVRPSSNEIVSGWLGLVPGEDADDVVDAFLTGLLAYMRSAASTGTPQAA